MRPMSRVIAIALVVGLGGAALPAQSWQMPTDAERCPSKWGAKDELGSGNLMKRKWRFVRQKLIHTGEVFQLGFDLFRELPLIGSRRFDLHMKRGTTTAQYPRRERGDRDHGAWPGGHAVGRLRSQMYGGNTTTALRTKR